MNAIARATLALLICSAAWYALFGSAGETSADHLTVPMREDLSSAADLGGRMDSAQEPVQLAEIPSQEDTRAVPEVVGPSDEPTPPVVQPGPYDWMKTAPLDDLRDFASVVSAEFSKAVDGKFDAYYDSGRYIVIDSLTIREPVITDGKVLPNCIRMTKGEMRLAYLDEADAPVATQLFTDLYWANSRIAEIEAGLR